LGKLKKNVIAEIILTKNNRKSLTQNLLNLKINSKNIIYFSKQSSLINTGVNFFKKKIKKFLTKKIISLENDLLKKLIINKKVSGKIDHNFFIDIGTEKNLLYARKKLPEIFHRPGLFLDRDGVINKDFGYVHSIKKLTYNKNIFSIIKNFQKKKFFTFIVTNQAGIAKGYYTLNDFFKFQNYIKKDFFKKGIFIDDVEFCPHHKDAIIKRYRKNCFCRKPNIQMIENIKKKWSVNTNQSLFIGDKLTDKICAKNSNLNFIYFNQISN
jgi:D-glycero-D-manno-heptose 1,7-bisphosphate phosphatase